MDVISEIRRGISSMMEKRSKLSAGSCYGIANDSIVLLIKDGYQLGRDEEKSGKVKELILTIFTHKNHLIFLYPK